MHRSVEAAAFRSGPKAAGPKAPTPESEAAAPEPARQESGDDEYWGYVDGLGWRLASEGDAGGYRDAGPAPAGFREWHAGLANVLRALGVTNEVAAQAVLFGRNWYQSLVENPSLAGFLVTELQAVEVRQVLDHLCA